LNKKNARCARVSRFAFPRASFAKFIAEFATSANFSDRDERQESTIVPNEPSTGSNPTTPM
jgi:hypothetical protein